MTYFYELGQVVTRDPEVRSGTLVFYGTRVRPFDSDLLEQAEKLVQGVEIAAGGSGPKDDDPPLFHQ